MPPAFFNLVMFWSKILGALGTAVGVLYGFFKWLLPKVPFVKQVNETSLKLDSLMNNHLHTIQSSLNAQDGVLTTIKSDVKNLDTKIEGVNDRLEDTKKGVHTLGESFLRHLEDAAKDREEMVSTASEVKKDLDSTNTAKNEVDKLMLESIHKIVQAATKSRVIHKRK